MSKISKRDDFRLKLMAKLVRGAKSILDVGLYFPNYYLRQYAKSAQIIGFDIVKQKLPSSYDKFVKGDINSVDNFFPKEKFDAILLGELIEHIAEPYKTLEKCHKILQKNGKLIISTPNPLSFPRIIFEIFSSRKYFYHKNHLFMYLPRWLIRMVEYSGFEVTNKTGIAFALPIRVPLIFADQMLIVAQKRRNN